MAAHLNSQPVPPIQIDPTLPSVFSDIILMAIAKNADHRFQTADAFRKALESVAGQFRSAGSITKVIGGPAACRNDSPLHSTSPPPPSARAQPVPAQKSSRARAVYGDRFSRHSRGAGCRCFAGPQVGSRAASRSRDAATPQQQQQAQPTEPSPPVSRSLSQQTPPSKRRRPSLDARRLRHQRKRETERLAYRSHRISRLRSATRRKLRPVNRHRRRNRFAQQPAAQPAPTFRPPAPRRRYGQSERAAANSAIIWHAGKPRKLSSSNTDPHEGITGPARNRHAWRYPDRRAADGKLPG